MTRQGPTYQLSERELADYSEQLAMQVAYDEWAAEKNMGLEMDTITKPRTVIQAYGRLRRAFRNHKEARKRVRGLSSGTLLADGYKALKIVNEADFRRMCLDKAIADYRQVKGVCDGKNT